MDGPVGELAARGIPSSLESLRSSVESVGSRCWRAGVVAAPRGHLIAGSEPLDRLVGAGCLVDETGGPWRGAKAARARTTSEKGVRRTNFLVRFHPSNATRWC